jgi:predicted DNA-binding transcriptional regulator AlpA
VSDTTTDNTTIIRRKALAERLGVSEVTLWRMRADLPAPIQISKGVKGWRAGDIATWLEKRSVGSV